MAKKSSVGEELKALGSEMMQAFKQMKSSKEFKDLEQELASSVKKVSTSLMKSLKAARDSEEASRLKNRMGRVVKVSKEKGGEQAQKAAKAGIEKFNKAFKKLSKKLHQN